MADQKSSKNEQCILALLQCDSLQDESVLVTAQQFALERCISLGAIFCLNDSVVKNAKDFDKLLIKLRQLEQSLQDLHIPLILMIGQSIERLQSAGKHFQPAAVFMYSMDYELAANLDYPVKAVGKSPHAKLQKHPYLWPKKWFTIDDLQPQLDAFRAELPSA